MARAGARTSARRNSPPAQGPRRSQIRCIQTTHPDVSIVRGPSGRISVDRWMGGTASDPSWCGVMGKEGRCHALVLASHRQQRGRNSEIPAMNAAWQVVGFGAVLVGFIGQYLSGRNRLGWLIGATSALMWTLPLFFGQQWAGCINSLISAGICIANWWRNRPQDTDRSMRWELPASSPVSGQGEQRRQRLARRGRRGGVHHDAEPRHGGQHQRECGPGRVAHTRAILTGSPDRPGPLPRRPPSRRVGRTADPGSYG